MQINLIDLLEFSLSNIDYFSWNFLTSSWCSSRQKTFFVWNFLWLTFMIISNTKNTKIPCTCGMMKQKNGFWCFRSDKAFKSSHWTANYDSAQKFTTSLCYDMTNLSKKRTCVCLIHLPHLHFCMQEKADITHDWVFMLEASNFFIDGLKPSMF